MKPPICHLCNRNLGSVKSHTKETGDLVRFADYQALPDGVVGHPHGLEWFCADHVAPAQALSERPIDPAMVELRTVFGPFPSPQPYSLLERYSIFRRLRKALQR